MLIDDLIEKNPDYAHASIDEGDTKPWRTVFLRDAIVFKIPWNAVNEAENYFKNKIIGEIETTYARAPYENIFLDISAKVGFWVVTKQFKTLTYSIVVHEFTPSADYLVSTTQSDIVRCSGLYLYPSEKIAKWRFLCGRQIDNKRIFEDVKSKIMKRENPWHHANVGLHIVIRILTLLNCKNIITAKVISDEKLSRKRIKKGKKPLFSYHILKIKDKLSHNPSEFRDLWTNRLHLCRGHFKEYTKENPLFGKHTGLYWWQPHIRGDKKRGIVMKDYQISRQTQERENV